MELNILPDTLLYQQNLMNPQLTFTGWRQTVSRAFIPLF